MQGRALDSEDLIDVITWKDNSATPGRFADALRLLDRAGDSVPDARRRLALGNIWRRVLLHDEYARALRICRIVG